MKIPKISTKLPSKKLIIIVGLVLLALFGGYWRIRSLHQREPLKINIKKAQVAKVQKGDITQYLTLAGKVDTERSVVLQFQTSGKLAWVGVKEGDKVGKWQAVASLDKSELQKRFQKTMNDYLTNRWNFEDTQDKYKQTKEDRLVTDEIKRILERTQFSLENSVLDVELADLTVKYATLVSPISGIVISLDQPYPGVNIIPSGATFTIADPSSIYLRSEIDEEDVTKVKVGQSTLISLDSFPDQEIESKISYIAFTPIQGQTSTVYQIKFELDLPNSDLKYKVGMNGDAKIKLAEVKDVLTVPVEAVFEEKDEKFVYLRTQKGKIEKKMVKTGIENDIVIEITEGLKGDETVIF